MILYTIYVAYNPTKGQKLQKKKHDNYYDIYETNLLELLQPPAL